MCGWGFWRTMQMLVGKMLHLRILDQSGGTYDGHSGNRVVGRVPPHVTKPRGPRSAAGIFFAHS